MRLMYIIYTCVYIYIYHIWRLSQISDFVFFAKYMMETSLTFTVNCDTTVAECLEEDLVAGYSSLDNDLLSHRLHKSL